MNVTQAVAVRFSVRAFRPDPVPAGLVREIMRKASQSPSGGNIQPWRVYALAGETLAQLKAAALANPEGEEREYAVYPPKLWEPFRTRRFQCGEALYATIDVPRADRPARLRQFARNGQMFGAPVGLFFCLDRRLGPPQWSDLGMLMQTVMLLATESGLGTCAQEYWAKYPQTLRRTLGLPDDHMVFSGMALGYTDGQAAINTLRTSRAPLEEWFEMTGF